MGAFTLLSQLLALFRDRSIAHYIGPSAGLDAYYAAFRLPDLIFISIASLASITALLPFISEKMQGEKVTEESRKFFSNILTVFLLCLVGVSFVAFLLMPELASVIAPGFSPALSAKFILLSRIMLLSPILMGLSNLFGAVTQLFRKFFIYSLSPVLYNLGIIIGVVFLYPVWGIEGLALGVALGALFHLSIQAITSFFSGFPLRFSWPENFGEIKRVVLVSVPRTLGLAFNNISLIVIVALASFLESGSISIFNFSFNLQSVPLNIIGISYAVAAFPTLVKSVTAGNKLEFREHLVSSARAIVFWSLPATFLFVVLRAQIVRVILGTGVFSWNDTRMVAASLAIFAVSVLAQGMTALLSRAYYAHGETKRPLIINFICSGLIIILAFLFTYAFKRFPDFAGFITHLLKVSDLSGTEVLALPLAYSLGTILNFILHWIYVKRDFMPKEPFIARTLWQSLTASALLGVGAYISLNILSPVFGTTTFLGIFLQGLLSGIFGILVAIAVLYLLKNKELRDLWEALKTKFWRSKVLVLQQEEL